VGELGLIPGYIPGPQFPDLFDPAWRARAAERIAQLVPAMSRDPRLIGYSLSAPLLFSPVMERPRIWRDGAIKRQNYLMATKSLPADSPGKRAYVEYLRRTYETFASYAARRGAPGGAKDFADLLAIDLSAGDRYEDLHPDDATFYSEMWGDLTGFFAREIRRH